MFERISKITDENISLYAIKNYTDINCVSQQEYDKDFGLIIQIKRSMSKYEDGNFNLRILMNYIIQFYNVFEHTSATSMLFYKIEPKHHSLFKTIITFLNYMPVDAKILDIDLDVTTIPIDDRLLTEIKEMHRC